MDAVLQDNVAQNGSDSPYSDETDGLLVVKIVAMIVLGISSFIVGIIPLKVAKYINMETRDAQKNNILISLLLCFGGGVLLFTTFLHLQPEVRESFLKLEQRKQIPVFGNGIPMAELVFCTGFFFVYLIEEVVHMLLEKRGNHQEGEVLQRSISLRRCSKANKNEEYQFNSLNNGVYHSNCQTFAYKGSEAPVSAKVEKKLSHSHIIDETTVKNSFHGLLTVLALSFHAIFEGLAVGLETQPTKVWYLFAAIATHKLVIAFCVGVELLSSKTKALLMVLYLLTFAIVTPVGIGIGIVLSETSGVGEEVVIATVLQGMAAGTLLYVVFFEVLARERKNDHDGIWQLMAIILGFAVMFVLQFLTGHNHDHDDADSIDTTTSATTQILDHHHHHHH